MESINLHSDLKNSFKEINSLEGNINLISKYIIDLNAREYDFNFEGADYFTKLVDKAKKPTLIISDPAHPLWNVSSPFVWQTSQPYYAVCDTLPLYTGYDKQPLKFTEYNWDPISFCSLFSTSTDYLQNYSFEYPCSQKELEKKVRSLRGNLKGISDFETFKNVKKLLILAKNILKNKLKEHRSYAARITAQINVIKFYLSPINLRDAFRSQVGFLFKNLSDNSGDDYINTQSKLRMETLIINHSNLLKNEKRKTIIRYFKNYTQSIKI